MHILRGEDRAEILFRGREQKKPGGISSLVRGLDDEWSDLVSFFSLGRRHHHHHHHPSWVSWARSRGYDFAKKNYCTSHLFSYEYENVIVHSKEQTNRTYDMCARTLYNVYCKLDDKLFLNSNGDCIVSCARCVSECGTYSRNAIPAPQFGSSSSSSNRLLWPLLQSKCPFLLPFRLLQNVLLSNRRVV